MKKFLNQLITICALLALNYVAKAQGGQNPILGSEHSYSVDAADAVSNGLSWIIVGGTASDYSISGEDTEFATITWNKVGNYTLRFTETANGTGCQTVREMSISVLDNTFDVSTTNPSAICNSKTNTVDPTGDAVTGATFVVSMETGVSGWDPDWEFSFTLTHTGGASAANSSVAASAGTISENSGVYTVTGIAGTTSSVNITMDIEGDVFTAISTTLNITAAKDLDSNVNDLTSNERSAVQNIHALPNTSIISAN